MCFCVTASICFQHLTVLLRCVWMSFTSSFSSLELLLDSLTVCWVWSTTWTMSLSTLFRYVMGVFATFLISLMTEKQTIIVFYLLAEWLCSLSTDMFNIREQIQMLRYHHYCSLYFTQTLPAFFFYLIVLIDLFSQQYKYLRFKGSLPLVVKCSASQALYSIRNYIVVYFFLGKWQLLTIETPVRQNTLVRSLYIWDLLPSSLLKLFFIWALLFYLSLVIFMNK